MEPRLSQHQSQKQILSPQIRQYLKLLQMPLMELTQAIEVELEENPMVEEIQSPVTEEIMPLGEKDEKIRETRETDELSLGENFDHFDRLDENFRDGYMADRSTSDPADQQRKINFQESLITKAQTLYDFLLFQIRFLEFSETELAIAEEIIGNIDEEGYVRIPLDEIAGVCNAEIKIVETVLKKIQTLDPPGIGARNLQEALILQLIKKGPEARLALEIVRNHLPLLEKRDWYHLAKVLETDIEKVKEASVIIAHLEPKPGRTYYSDEAISVTPEATVSFAEDGKEKFKIEIHDEILPELRLNTYYRRLMRLKNTDEATKVFLREKMQRAINFLKAIKLRKSTLREITEQIVKVQEAFFEKGFSHLIPLRLKDIANQIGIHESTVSRAIQGKYISTPQGTIPYKSFFSTKLQTTTGEAESQKSIMEKIRKLVDKEDPKNPLSDQELVTILQNEGIKIARRTIAKYRDLLRILPSHLRRQK